MTENSIQEILFQWLREKKQTLITPNVSLFWGEADLISVSRTGYSTEFEIKCSLSDYRRDFRTKPAKHKRLQDPKSSHGKKTLPNYFVFVFPEEIYYKHNLEVPACYGVVLIKDGNAVQVRKPTLLHRVCLSDRNREYLGRGLMLRYWGKRLAA